MKSIVVLLLCGALAWTFLKLYPEQREARGGTVQAGESTRGSEPEFAEPTAGKPVERESETSGLFEPAADAADNPLAADAVPLVAGATPEDVTLGGLLAHGMNSQAVDYAQRFAAELPDGAPALVHAFALALEGREDDARARAEELVADEAVSGRGMELLRASLAARSFPLPPAEPGVAPFVRGMELALFRETALRAKAQNRHALAAELFSELLRGELDADWDFDPQLMETWSAALREVQARHRWNPQGGWPSIEMVAQPGDSLARMRKRYLAEYPDRVLCTGLIERANGLGSSLIRENQALRIPTDPVHVLVDVGKRWLLYMIGGEVVDSWSVGVGRDDQQTLLGEFEAGIKQKEPMHFRRGLGQIPYGHPDNKLGTRWIGWRAPGATEDTSYGFHGTWEPESIGQAASEGCVRMANANAELLFEVLPTGATLEVRG